MSHSAQDTLELANHESQKYHAFITLALFLAVMTSVEIIIIFLPFASWVIISVLVVLSVVKFICVILWFMHLIYDKMLLLMLFCTGMVLATGTIAALLLLLEPEDLDYQAYSLVFDTVKTLWVA